MLTHNESKAFIERLNADYPLVLEFIKAFDLEIESIGNTQKENAIDLAKWAFGDAKEIGLLAFVEKIETRLKNKERTQKSVLYFVNENICGLFAKNKELELPKIRLLV